VVSPAGGEYVAVSVFVTVVADVKFTTQLPVPLARVIVQFVVAPVMATCPPLGIPKGSEVVTVTNTVTAWPDVEGSGEVDVMVVTVVYLTL
jgi:hypothetical protein